MAQQRFFAPWFNCSKRPKMDDKTPSVEGNQVQRDAKRLILPPAEKRFWSGDWTLVSLRYIPPPKGDVMVWLTLISVLLWTNWQQRRPAWLKLPKFDLQRAMPRPSWFGNVRNHRVRS